MLSEHGQLCQGRAAPTVLGGAPWEEIPNDGLPRYPERAPA